MNKIKVVNKLGLSQLILKSLKGQQLNENEVYAINSNTFTLFGKKKKEEK